MFVTDVKFFGSTVAAGITNIGTISAGSTGIYVTKFTSFGGGISNQGVISSGYSGIDITSGTTFTGGITNSGTVSSAKYSGIDVSGISTFAGGISNSGLISTGTVNATAAVNVNHVSNFSGGITNSGTLTAPKGAGLAVLNATTFNGGITNSGLISSTNSFGINIEAGKTFSGGIVNSAGGKITAKSSAIIVESVSNFSGGIINSGTLSSSGQTGINLASLSVFNGNIVNNGLIAAKFVGIAAFVSTFTGGITNFGTITATNASTPIAIVISGIKTFAGGITNSGFIGAANIGIQVGSFSNFSGGISNGGTISAGNSGIFIETMSTFAGGITNSGTIIGGEGIVVSSTISTFSGAIANSGEISVSGAAIDISLAPNNMTVDILGGTISGNILGNGTANGDTVNFNLGGTFAYGSTITGVQTVNVNSGTLFDGGAITAGSVNVNAGGVLAPGLPHTVGTLNIAGNLVFASAAAYLETISGAASSKTTVTGAVTLGGASVRIASGSTVTAGTKYTILTDTLGGLGGGNIFSPTVTYNGQTGTLSYDADDVYLMFGSAAPANLLALLPPGAPQNVVNVANAIDNFLAGGGTPPAGFQNLFNLSPTQLQNDLSQLDGENATGAQTSAFTLMTEFVDLMLGQSGGAGGNGGGLGFAPDLQTEALPPEIALAYDSILKAPPKPQTFDQRWSVWGAGFGGTATFNGNATVGSNNVTASTYGSAAGMEYRVDPHTVYGFALAGSGLNWGLAQNLGTGRSDSFQAGVYAKTYWGPAYLTGAAAFGNNWFTTNRIAVGDQLTASFSGQSYALRGEAGYRYTVTFSGALIGVTPYGALQTQWFHTPAYSETDLTGGGLGLSYNANTANDTRSELGARFDDLTTWSNKPLILRGRLAWAHDWMSGTGLNAVFEALPGSNFTVNGAALPRDSALTGASAQYFFTPALSFTAKFDGEFAPSAQTYAGSGTLKYTW
jgi:uncharacterized protein with beta-barrel porin domain